MNNYKKGKRLLAKLFAASALCATTLNADDTEIFFSDRLTTVNPNVMFVVDVSGSMDEEIGDEGKSRLEVMQEALKTVLKTAPQNLNVGLMNYGEVEGRDEGHGVKFPATDIQALALPVVEEKFPLNEWGKREWWHSSIPAPEETTTVRDYLSQITDWYWKDDWYSVTRDDKALINMPHVGTTPIVDALYEAAMYFRGEKVSFGLGSSGHWERWAAHPSTYEGEMIKWDSTICNDTWTRTRNTKVNFDEEQQPWWRCPADPDNPTSPGTYENCRANEQCTTTEKQVCANTIEGYCTDPQVDEGGESFCPAGAWVDDYCEDDVYVTETKTQCKYVICDGDHTSKPNYQTPITQSCQSNFIVLLSDGKPQYSHDYDKNGDRDGTNKESPTYWNLESGEFPAIVDKSDTSKTFDHTNCADNRSPNGFTSGACGPELTQFLSTTDNSDVTGKQTIDTYAIGFGLTEEPEATKYLQSLVSTDDPSTEAIEGYFSAEDEVQLSQAFSEILSRISSTTTSFASPGYSIDLRTGLYNEEFIYIPVFDKQLSPRWSGNLKKFKLKVTTADDGVSHSSIVGKTGATAVSELGVFEDEAVDFWSNSTAANPDGKEVSRGGVAQLINPETRKAYTDLACTTNDCTLNTAGNLVTADNVAGGSGVGLITNEVLGLDDEANQEDRAELINFIRGRRLNSETGEYESHPHMGDMLHTEPLIITYDKDHREKATAADYNKQVIYAATNEGYIHAFDTHSGKELFAFMPSSLMKNIQTQYYNSDLGNHAYGIDGIITSWVHDADKDGVISTGSGDQVILYFGLRRGGREYYALDVTNPLNPKLKWKLSANAQAALDADTSCSHEGLHTGEDNSEGEHTGQYLDDPACRLDSHQGLGHFKNLGQSWSAPYLAKIRVDSSTAAREVAIFTGGYDINQDTEDSALRETTDNVGNDIFIVDAKTGAFLWSAKSGGPEGGLGGPAINANLLTHSIPGGARLLDMNQDGAVDRMYFADMAGQVFRLELPIGPSYGLSGAKIIKFADLGGNEQGKRMFYNEPDVSLFKHLGKRYLSVAIGTGYRSHPANEEMTDRFYVLLDDAVNSPLETKLDSEEDFTTITESNLVEVKMSGDGSSSTLSRGSISDQTILDVQGKSGWYFVMPSEGEKVLATSITAEGNVMFTTLVPDSRTAGSVLDLCEAPITQGRYYSMNILTAKPGSDLNDDGVITTSDIYTVVTANEIPGTPQRVFNVPQCTEDKCFQTVDIRVGKKNSALDESDVSKLENVFWTDPEK